MSKETTYRSSARATPPENPSALTFLVVDDNEDSLFLVEDILTDAGFKVVTAVNGLDALEAMEGQRIHFIIADAMMPKMDGFQFCKAVREKAEYRSIPIIIYTGDYLDKEDEEFARTIGVDRYVVKSGGSDPLMEVVMEYVRDVYGLQKTEVAKPSPKIDEQEFLEQHHAVLVRKLEQKMTELELYAESLAEKNRALVESETRYRNLFEHTTIAKFVLDKSTGRVLDVNNQAVALLGYSKMELVNMKKLPIEGYEEVMPQILDKEELHRGECRIMAEFGEVLDVEFNATPVELQHDNRILLSLRDISEEKKLREQMVQMEKMSLMGRLVSTIAHEIRNPLAAVTLNLQFIKEKYGTAFGDADSIDAALEGATRIQQVIEKTLSLARPSPPNLRPEQMNDVLKRSLWFVKLPMLQKRIIPEEVLTENLPLVQIDAKQMEQVFLNLLQNAIEASPAESTIRVATSVITETPELFQESTGTQYVVITIRDYGVGFSPDQLKHLFEPFRTTKQAGNGLGLALAKQIIERHKGTISIDPAPTGGTIVRVILPTVITEDQRP